MPEYSTPMMRQYMEVKKEYQDCLLFFRMGDFYELFFDDAKTGAQVLNITLTGRQEGKDGRVPMAGVPFHAVDAYLSKLVKAGYKVAICEQVSPPNKYGIIKREVIRIVTPGTMLDEKALEKKEHNYLISLTLDDQRVGLAAVDLSTGKFLTTQIEGVEIKESVINELARINPVECILPLAHYNNSAVLSLLKSQKGMNIYPFHEWDLYTSNSSTFLKKHFGVQTIKGFGIEDKLLAVQASAALLGYLKLTQKNHIDQIKTLQTYASGDHMVLDRSTIMNLELFATIRDQDRRGSLVDVIDHTATAMGGRLLREWIRKPLIDKKEISSRHDAVAELLRERDRRYKLIELLEEINDIERILSRLSAGIGNARDMISLKYSLSLILSIQKELQNFKPLLLQKIRKQISPVLKKIIALIEMNIVDEPPIDLREGGLIKPNINKELDKLRSIVGGSRNWILELEQKERERTGIATLKIKFNKVFGFYIEISKGNAHLAPSDYMRKQTLVNGERFITPELKKHEEIILTAEEKINALEYQLFGGLLQKIIGFMDELQQTSYQIAVLDCLISFAATAEKEDYCRPILKDSGEINIKQGRHPVVEKLLEDSQFVPNDVCLNLADQQVIIITGPNMAGKSVYIRQVALIVLLTQIGSFVPAKEATVSPVDRIFVRSGASDFIASGLSTFMVEMVETANILNNATPKSLIVMDEIGRGTSTYDGISIAWAVAEYLVTHKQTAAKTLFATHYHELQALQDQYPNSIKNYHMSVKEKDGHPVFLHTVLPGGASHSFGVAVARMAGVPEEAVKRAYEILKSLEKRNPNKEKRTNGQKELPFKKSESQLLKELAGIDIHNMTPLQALNKLAEIKSKL